MSSTSGRTSSPSRTTSPPPDDNSESAQHARTLQELKTTKNALAEALGNKKRARSDFTIGRVLRKCVVMFGPLSNLIDEADRRAVAGDHQPAEPGDDEDVKRDQDRLYVGFHAMLRLVPDLMKKLIDPDLEPEEVDAFLGELQNRANDGRTSDVSRIKAEVAIELNSAPTKPSTPFDIRNRSGRGIQDDVTGKLLSSVLFDWDNESVRTAYRSGTDPNITMASNYFCRCFYAGGKGDPSNLEKGFLRSKLLLKTWAAIFTSPSSTENINDNENEAPDSDSRPAKKHKGANKRATKSNVALLCRLNGQVTPRTIAYAAVLLHFNLMDASSWQEEYCGFSYEGLWNFIVDYFEGPADAESKEAANKLLEWWTKHVFPYSIKGPEAQGTIVNSRQLLLAQRQARLQPQ